jgi:site-specific DNA recombinase
VSRAPTTDAQHESEQIGERVRDAKVDAMMQGLYLGEPCPFAFEADGQTLRSIEHDGEIVGRAA